MSKDSIQQRMETWMADYGDPTGAFRPIPDRDTLLDEAFGIIKECHPKFVTNGFIKEFCRLNPHLFSKELKNG